MNYYFDEDQKYKGNEMYYDEGNDYDNNAYEKQGKKMVRHILDMDENEEKENKQRQKKGVTMKMFMQKKPNLVQENYDYYKADYMNVDSEGKIIERKPKANENEPVEEEEIFIKADQIQMKRVFCNLLDNAIKYHFNGTTLTVRVQLDNETKVVLVQIKDNGIGIPASDQQRIFERFYRVENNIHTITGTGLGLHLVKTTVEKHHQGKVFVESQVGEGSTFGFMLPMLSLESLDEQTEQTV